MATRDYEGDGIVVHWDSTRCVHVAECMRAQPEVFDSRRRPWVITEGASAADIAAAIDRCPTGALRYTLADGRAEPVPSPPEVFAVQNGPLVVRGPLTLLDDDGAVASTETRVALCRCGNSRNQPFCDSSHRRVRWESTPPIPAAEAKAPAEICEPQPERFT